VSEGKSIVLGIIEIGMSRFFANVWGWVLRREMNNGRLSLGTRILSRSRERSDELGRGAKSVGGNPGERPCKAVRWNWTRPLQSRICGAGRPVNNKVAMMRRSPVIARQQAIRTAVL